VDMHALGERTVILDCDVIQADGGLIETQATAEKGSYSRAQLNGLLDLAEVGLTEIFAAQRDILSQ
jgi:ribonuclease PH